MPPVVRKRPADGVTSLTGPGPGRVGPGPPRPPGPGLDDTVPLDYDVLQRLLAGRPGSVRLGPVKTRRDSE